MRISKIEKIQLNKYAYFYSVTVTNDTGEVVSIQHFNDGTAGRSEIFFAAGGSFCLLHLSKGEFQLFRMVELDEKKIEDFC